MDITRAHIYFIPNLSSSHINIIDAVLWDSTLTGAIILYLDILRKHQYTVPYSDIFNCTTYIDNTHHINADRSTSNDPLDDFSLRDHPPIYKCGDHIYDLNSNNSANSCDTTDTTTESNKDTTHHSLVVNLSSSHLTPTAIDILSKGVKFCPTPGEPDISKAQNDLSSFHLRLKRFLHFNAPAKDDNMTSSNTRDTQSDPNGPFKDQQFKNPSSWVPPPCIPLEVFIAQNNSDLIQSSIHAPRRQNITKEQREAIQALKDNRDIVIKPADKGGAMVILDRDQYIKEGLRQLSDTDFYVQTDTDLSKQHHEEIKSQVDAMCENNEIDKSCADYLCDPEYRTSQFYMLPKIHKRLDNPPGRPIVSGNGCPTERISKFVDFFLKPIVQDVQSYIKDTTHFLVLLKELGRLPDNAILVTLDVSSLYTNIPNDLGIQACKEKLSQYRSGETKPTNSSILKLLDFVLKKNNFDFNDLHYLQVGGTAMGTRLAPSYANLFMDYFETHYVYTYETQPLLWKRYIDDIFMIWTHDGQALQRFIDHLNNCLPSIKFEANISDRVINFLDVKVLLRDNHIKTSLYTKDTDTLSYLDYSSCHPRSCKNAIPYSQFLRLRRICSEDDDFVIQSEKLAMSFHQANYPDDVIQTGFDRAYYLDRDSLLNKSTSNSNKDDDPKLFLITDHHPSFRAVLDIVSNNWDMLDNSSSTRPLLQIPVVRGFRRPKNLRDILVRARLTTPDSQGNSKPKKSINKCKRSNCTYCKFINRSGRITCPFNKRSYISRYNVSCTSNNLVYCLSCKVCQKIYVGQTKRALRARIGEHFTSVRRKKKHMVVGRHYNSAGHSGIRNITVFVLEFVNSHPDAIYSKKRRESAEQKWIFRLRSSVPLGLNLMD